MPTYLSQPTLEGRCIPWRLGIEHRARLPQGLDAPDLDLCGIGTFELLAQPIARGAAALSRVEVGDDRLDERVRPSIHLGSHQCGTAGQALLEQAPKPARLGRRYCDAGHHDALQEDLPFVGRKARFVCHGRASISLVYCRRLLSIIAAKSLAVRLSGPALSHMS